VLAVDLEQPFRGCLFRREAGNSEDGFVFSFIALEVSPLPVDFEYLTTVREIEIVIENGRGRYGSDFKPAVRFVDCLEYRGEKRFPYQEVRCRLGVLSDCP